MLAAVSPIAARLGLTPGMALADARAQVPDLAVQPHDPAADAALVARLATLCRTFTPSAAAEPGGLMLDIAGCDHLFGGEDAMQARIVDRIAGSGVTARGAIADTPDAARALARFAVARVPDLPLAALAMDEDAHIALRRAGFRTIGDIAELPRAPLAARFGPHLVRLLARLLGEENAHLDGRHAPPPPRFDMRFAEPVGHRDSVLDAIEALAEMAATELRERGEGGRAFRVRLHRADGHVATLAVETGAATRDTERVMRLMRERIDSLADPLDPGFGYDMIDLAVARTEPLDPGQQRFDAKAEPSRDIGALLDRLAVRYGPERLLGFAAGDSHVPERAGRLTPRGEAHTTDTAPWPATEPGEPPQRPLLLFDPPQPVEVIAAVPDGPPRRFRWRGNVHRIVRQEGPERIAREWWRRRDGHAANPGRSRDYYRIEDEQGCRFWLFRLGLYEREPGLPEWYVHGVFA